MSPGPEFARRRGEPLLALFLLVAAWTGARFMLWESPFAATASDALKRPRQALSARAPVASSTNEVGFKATPAFEAAFTRAKPAPSSVVPSAAAIVSATIVLPPAHELLVAVPSQEPTDTTASASRPLLVQPLIAPTSNGGGRWHLDGWLAWRQGSGLPRVANGPRPASYGGTQAGALAQYDLAGGPHRPALHLRATYAPDRPHQAEVAVGAGIRPLAGVPVSVLAEARVTQSSGHTEVRPAAFAVSELPPLHLPPGLVAEGYAQGGWVGGRYSTAFVDGQARLAHKLLSAGPAQLRLGAGAWGGAQKFAERVDVGPTAMVEMAPLRLSIDYRMRVAGRASPGNGLAVTLSTSF